MNFSLVRFILLDLSKVGFPNFFQVCRFIIVKSEPETNCNFTILFRICTWMYFLMFNSSFSSDFVFFTELLIFLSLDSVSFCARHGNNLGTSHSGKGNPTTGTQVWRQVVLFFVCFVFFGGVVLVWFRRKIRLLFLLTYLSYMCYARFFDIFWILEYAYEFSTIFWRVRFARFPIHSELFV